RLNRYHIRRGAAADFLENRFLQLRRLCGREPVELPHEIVDLVPDQARLCGLAKEIVELLEIAIGRFAVYREMNQFRRSFFRRHDPCPPAAVERNGAREKASTSQLLQSH